MKVNTVLFLLLSGLAFVGIGAAGFYKWRMQIEQREVHACGEAIRYDDFTFAVVGARRAASLGEGAAQATARGVFVVVQMRITNEARRVEFTFRPETARLIDARGELHELSPAGQAALAALDPEGCHHPLPPGGTCTVELAFDVAPDALTDPDGAPGPPFVGFSFGAGILDMLDVIVYGNRLLEVPEASVP